MVHSERAQIIGSDNLRVSESLRNFLKILEISLSAFSNNNLDLRGPAQRNVFKDQWRAVLHEENKSDLKVEDLWL